MLPDFEMIQHQFYGGHDIKVIPIADVHLGSPECKEQEFIKFIDKIAQEENTYLILAGDLIDNGTRSSVTDPFKAKMPPSQQKREMANILSKVHDKILCFVPGNHERRSRKDADDDPVYDIAAKLDLENLYRENIAFLKIQLGQKNVKSGFYRPTYTIAVTHGAGGGILTGAAVNRSERFGYIFEGLDALIVGHTHKPYVTQPGKLSVDSHNNKITIKPFKVISATSWLDYGGYAAQKMLLPSSFCPNSLTLRGKGDRSKAEYKEILVTM